MKDFFTFYKNIGELKTPFLAFSFTHLLFLALTLLGIVLLYRKYLGMRESLQKRFLTGMAVYFIVEEMLYTTWLFLNCHTHVWQQVLPLELCSLCAYMNACSVFLKKDYLRFFSGVVGLIAGAVAMLYPANISALYPIISYRVINFYLLHGSFILFALIQLRDKKLLEYVHLKKNTCIIFSMFTFAFFVNLKLKTQFMFVGTPPNIGFIHALYERTGFLLFLPTILCILFILQYFVVFVLRRAYRIPSCK